VAEIEEAPRWTPVPGSAALDPPPSALRLPASPSGSSSLPAAPIGLNHASSTFNGNPGSGASSVSPPQLLESFDTPSQQFHLPTSALHKHTRSQDSQTEFTFTSGSQNRLTFIAKDFQKTLKQCAELVESTPISVSEKISSLLASVAEELRALSALNSRLTASSSKLPSYSIEKAIETLAICRTQVLRFQRFLESTNTNWEAIRKKDKRQSRGLSRLFGRPSSTDLLDISKGETILTDMRIGRSALANIIPVAPQQSSEASPSRLSEHGFLEAFDPRIRGRIFHDFDVPRPKETFPQSKTSKDLSQMDRENSSSHFQLPSELVESRFQGNTGIVTDETNTAPELGFESDPITGEFPISRVEEGIEVSPKIGTLNEVTAPDANRAVNENQDQARDSPSEDDEGDIAYPCPCKGCGIIVSKVTLSFRKPSSAF